MSSATISKSAKLDRVKERLLAALSRLEEAVDAADSGQSGDKDDGRVAELQGELDRLKTENTALREAAAEASTIQAENKTLRDVNAEATRQVAVIIRDLQQCLNEPTT